MILVTIRHIIQLYFSLKTNIDWKHTSISANKVPFEVLDACVWCCDLFPTLPPTEYLLHLWSRSNDSNTFPDYDLDKRRITFPRTVFNRFQPQTSANKRPRSFVVVNLVLQRRFLFTSLASFLLSQNSTAFPLAAASARHVTRRCSVSAKAEQSPPIKPPD